MKQVRQVTHHACSLLFSGTIRQNILKCVTRSWYPVPMCDVHVSTFPRIYFFQCVELEVYLGRGGTFDCVIRVSSVFRGTASKWQGILQLRQVGEVFTRQIMNLFTVSDKILVGGQTHLKYYSECMGILPTSSHYKSFRV